MHFLLPVYHSPCPGAPRNDITVCKPAYNTETVASWDLQSAHLWHVNVPTYGLLIDKIPTCLTQLSSQFHLTWTQPGKIRVTGIPLCRIVSFNGLALTAHIPDTCLLLKAG
jgi:hypothetical protein